MGLRDAIQPQSVLNFSNFFRGTAYVGKLSRLSGNPNNLPQDDICAQLQSH